MGEKIKVGCLVLKNCDGSRIELVLPKRPKLRQLVDIYRKHCAADLKLKLDAFERMSVEQVVEYAGRGKEYNGVSHIGHLRRAPTNSLKDAVKVLSGKYKALKGFKNFDDIYGAVENSVKPIHRLKGMYFYDIALRIGVSKGLWPGKVYLQCGALVGAKNLFRTWKPEDAVNLPTLECSAFPPELNCLNAAEIENFLCIFEKHLKDVKL
jgi:hypothetical protein